MAHIIALDRRYEALTVVLDKNNVIGMPGGLDHTA